MLIEQWMPRYDVRAVHSVIIASPPDIVYDVLLRTDVSRLGVVRVLMGFRALPALVRFPRETWARLRRPRAHGRVPLFALEDFIVLEEAPGQEIVLGLTGRFWTLAGGLVPTHAAAFRSAIPGGYARAAWSFRVVERPSSRTELITETRVRCADESARRSFLRYWWAIAPGSGLMRRSILSSVRRRAEAARCGRATNAPRA